MEQMNRNRAFPHTRWTRVAHASDARHPLAQAALSELFQLYWYPIYAFIRSKGHPHQDAEELTQGFFVYVLEHGTFGKADKARGRFRTFVLACLENFLHGEHRRAAAAKRGGPEPTIEFDGLAAESRYAAEPVDDRTPEHLFAQTLAQTVLDDAIAELEAECADEGLTDLFKAVRDRLSQDGAAEGYNAISARLNMKVGTIKSHVSRLRDRLRTLVRERVGHLVENEDDVRSEMVALEEAL
jgi:RNA polymerase sigma factor (sigma-70 family)